MPRRRPVLSTSSARVQSIPAVLRYVVADQSLCRYVALMEIGDHLSRIDSFRLVSRSLRIAGTVHCHTTVIAGYQSCQGFDTGAYHCTECQHDSQLARRQRAEISRTCVYVSLHQDNCFPEEYGTPIPSTCSNTRLRRRTARNRRDFPKQRHGCEDTPLHGSIDQPTHEDVPRDSAAYCECGQSL